MTLSSLSRTALRRMRLLYAIIGITLIHLIATASNTKRINEMREDLRGEEYYMSGYATKGDLEAARNTLADSITILGDKLDDILQYQNNYTQTSRQRWEEVFKELDIIMHK